MTDNQRGSAANLMYLCGPHHDAIDSQLHFHTTEYLLTAKLIHESSVARGVKHALGAVGFRELEVVCTVLSSAVQLQGSGNVELALPLQEKINLNLLGPESVQRITDGLSQVARVSSFVSFQNEIQPEFGRQLAAKMKANYYSARSCGLGPDESFDFIVDSAFLDSGPIQASPVPRRVPK